MARWLPEDMTGFDATAALLALIGGFIVAPIAAAWVLVQLAVIIATALGFDVCR